MNETSIISENGSAMQAAGDPKVSMKWRGAKSALHMTASILSDVPACSATLKITDRQSCDAAREIKLNQWDQCILKTEPGSKGSCVFDYSRLTGLNEDAVLVYTITDS